jgi:tetratricopeptide (TPR) repeat protein
MAEAGIALLDRGRSELVTVDRAELIHRQLVGHTWELTLDLLASQGSPTSRTFMRLRSCFAVEPLPVEIFDVEILQRSGLIDKDSGLNDADRALEALVDVGLIEVADMAFDSAANERPCLLAHRLVLEANANRLADEPRDFRFKVWRAAAEMLETATGLSPEDPSNSDYWQVVAPHCIELVNRLPVDSPSDLLEKALAIGLRCFAALWFRNQGIEARLLAETMNTRSVLLDQNSPVRLSIRHRHALAYLDDPEAGLNEYQDILRRQQQVQGSDDPDTLITHHQVAATLRRIGRLEEAESGLRYVLSKRREVLGASDPYTLITHAELASLFSSRGDNDQATQEYIALSKAAISEHDYLSLSNRHQMAHAYDRLERYLEAEAEYRAIRRELADEGAGDSRLSHSLARCLAVNLRNQDRLAEAVEILDDLLVVHAGSKSDCGCNQEWLMSMEHLRGDYLRILGRVEEAEQQIIAVLDRRRASGVSEADSELLNERHCLAHAFEANGKPDLAEREYREIVRQFESVFGDIESNSARAYFCLAKVLADGERWEEAERYFETVLAHETSSLGEDHSDTLVTRMHLYLLRYDHGLISREVIVTALSELLAKQIRAVGEGSRRVKNIRDKLLAISK